MSSSFTSSVEFQATVDDAITRAHELFALRSEDMLSSNDSLHRAPNTLASLGTIPAKMLANGCDTVDAAVGLASHAFVSCVDALVSSLRMRMILGEQPSVLAHELSASIEQATNSIASNFEHSGFEASCAALQRAVANNGMSAHMCMMVIEAMRLAGLTGRVRTELCVGARTDSIELTNGHTFSAEAVLRTNDVTPWVATNARCVFIDGIIESVSEIDGMLHHAHSSREPLLICARGFGDDVVSTVATNRARRTLDAHIIKVPFDIAGANMLKDMAVTIDADVVSSLQGSLISTIKFNELKRARRITVIGGVVTMSSHGQNQALQLHVSELARKRAACCVSAMRDAYSERIKSLSGTSVAIKLSGSKRVSAAKLYEADTALRSMRMLLSHGCVADETLVVASGIACDAVSVTAKELARMYGVVPAAGLVVVLNAATECAAALCLSAGAVMLD